VSEFDQYIETYDCACQRGLDLTGEDRDFYARRRVALTQRMCPDPRSVREIIDFGCGLGHTAPHLLAAFPNARLLGIDNSTDTIDRAERTYGNDRTRFAHDGADWPQGQVDLIYCNGVFHHIPIAERSSVVDRLLRSLRPGGLFALWENNPWNPGTRFVMKRIPFDRDAIVLSCLEAAGLVRGSGFSVERTTFHFYFPRFLAFLRVTERLFESVPLGGQYCVFARRPLPGGAAAADD
jgi:SAM-dependent methyltransferase